MPDLRERLVALVAIVVAASTGIAEAPALEVPAELTGLHARAELGDPDAQVSLGFRYRRGNGLPQNDATAARWFRAAADRGNATAQFNLGFHYREGRGVPQDDANAVRWYRRAAEQGDADAQNNLGGMYARGNGVPPNGPEAMRWWTLAADQGHPVAQSNLGFMYGEGLGLPEGDAGAVRRYGAQDYVRAHMWLDLAASHGTGAVRDGAMQGRDRAAQKLSAAQLTEARRLAREWRPARPAR